MILISKERIEDYESGDDWVMRYLEKKLNSDFVCDQWLINSLPKRFIYNLIYRDLLNKDSNMKVYDVGGGITSFTSKLSEYNDYNLVDILAHGGDINNQNKNKGRIIKKDWYDINFQPSEIVIANDLFPNVDQRVVCFIEKLIPTTKLIRMTLTWYSSINFYKTKRIDGDEILFMNSWLLEDIKKLIYKFSSRIINYDISILNLVTDSVFKNNRNICYIQIKGDL